LEKQKNLKKQKDFEKQTFGEPKELREAMKIWRSKRRF
jgi:hypothetical protein